MAMQVFPRFFLLCCVSILLTFLFSACVSKVKYLDTLQEVQTIRTETELLKADLEGANQQILAKEELVSGLQGQVQHLRELTQETRSASLDAQQALGDQLKSDRERLGVLMAEHQELRGVVTPIEAALVARAARVAQLRKRLSSSLVEVPEGQVKYQVRSDAILLTFDEVLFFGASGGSRINAFGESLVSRLASALGGQMDLSTDVIAYPGSARLGSLSAWKQASAKASIVASALVEGHGLLPRLVNAVGREGNLVVIDGAPAEFGGSTQRLELLVRVEDKLLETALEGLD